MVMVINNRVSDSAITLKAAALIGQVRQYNDTVNGAVVFNGTPITRDEIAGKIAEKFQPNVNGGHGNDNTYVSAFGKTSPTWIRSVGTANLAPATKAHFFWMNYARWAAPKHASDGICTCVEFYCGGSATTRLCYEYMRRLFLYTTDHYTTYHLVVDAQSILARDF